MEILQIAVLVITAGIGVIGLFAPGSITGFIGLIPDGVRGISELRAIFGGLFIGLGVAPLALNVTEAYQVVGIGYLAIAAARAFSIVYDQSYARSNILSVASEIVFGIILLL
mgnify:FL=1